jgi:hypothetical protein
LSAFDITSKECTKEKRRKIRLINHTSVSGKKIGESSKPELAPEPEEQLEEVLSKPDSIEVSFLSVSDVSFARIWTPPFETT